jgi:hypothetical protein
MDEKFSRERSCMIADDLDEADKEESIQHYARKKREGLGLGGIIGILVLIIFIVASYFLFFS